MPKTTSSNLSIDENKRQKKASGKERELVRKRGGTVLCIEGHNKRVRLRGHVKVEREGGLGGYIRQSGQRVEHTIPRSSFLY